MAAILRVKRKREDEPLDALLISCKRRKLNTDDPSSSIPLTAIVKFAGTVEKEGDCVVEHITKNLSKEELKTNFKQHIVDISKRVREKTRKKSRENRYKIINNIRSIDNVLAEDSGENVVQVIDVEDTKATVPDDKENIDCVYDLYYTEIKEAIQIENLVSVSPMEEDFVFGDYHRDNDQEYQGESEDSNSESNWRNDYPDSEHSNDSFDEKAIGRAMKSLDIEDELPCDGGDGFVYGLDEEDVERYGYKYAKFKAKAFKEQDDDDSISVDSDDSDDEFNDSDENEQCNDDCMD